ncbi:alpha/beta fold hydrolase [Aurantiacibacter gangjinensis]|uniref:Uncharacterized protein n=1 Tax=Aurantiacibacter gangjinensis TaxID=502682 RepID=A0A0G9MPQ1_9SPHN|nr:alpha/beta hydrolase [Aurantiacibacter gangjinensis]APE28486.1 putative epoxide hydrolase [Aurantiacibacter gangjinensis]KLE32691.1 hypothetical protein AAW01_01150 [Aurantiacibacter gangjinensis]
MQDRISAWARAARHFTYAGHELVYWTAGDGPPLLLVHGFPTSSFDWMALWDDLARTHTVIACDFLGFGLSDKPAQGLRGNGYDLMDQADVLAHLLRDVLRIEAFDAVVHDYGVSVGQEMLARQVEGAGFAGLGRMIFLNGGIYPHQHRPLPIQTLGLSPLGPLVSALMNRRRFGRSFCRVFGPDSQPTAEELDAHWHFISHKNGHRNTHRLLRYMTDRKRHAQRWVGALTTVEMRIGHINGALDPVSGAHVYRHWREHLPNASHALLENVGHYPQIEAPERVLALIGEWLASGHA